ncbi:mannose-6-phosphate isomerase, class I [Salibacterium halotolerans]|uniref:Mannose-6-phosphate isomerase n=1 Tax=Salibacterium halotolerans TaxID=1884432 RepID=A0A1I5RJ86_9BACI|nr:mannose-6-phosphate isomerase, class I [Salibacterium halotolerans]SFP58634.1 mannose-6-phosphate isomerase [Salibacterium halotolerans]
MYNEPLFLEPVLKERIWGGTKLNEAFGYFLPSDQTGECWGISAHPNGACTIKNGPLHGQTLRTAWKEHRELFGREDGEEFPLLVKLLDAADDLSVQVHPDDSKARVLEEGEAFGKTECWYVVQADPGASLILGHNADSKEELEKRMKEGDWEALLRTVPVQAGDFFYVPSGTIHAIGGGALILETQQSSDTTYRVYDYDRTDADGNKRELHLGKSLEAAKVPHKDPKSSRDVVHQGDNGVVEQLVHSPYFQVYRMHCRSRLSPGLDAPYVLATVLRGEGTIETEEKTIPVEKGQHFIIPATMQHWEVKGDIELIVSTRQ